MCYLPVILSPVFFPTRSESNHHDVRQLCVDMLRQFAILKVSLRLSRH